MSDDEFEDDEEFDDSDAFVRSTNGYVGDAETLLRRAIDIIASVAIKAGMRSRVTISPEVRPHAADATRAPGLRTDTLASQRKLPSCMLPSQMPIQVTILCSSLA